MEMKMKKKLIFFSQIGTQQQISYLQLEWLSKLLLEMSSSNSSSG